MAINSLDVRTSVCDLVEGKRRWEEHDANMRDRLTNAYRILGVVLLIALVLAIAMLVTRTKPTVVPYVAAIDEHTGRVLFMATTRAASRIDESAVMRDQLERWIWDARTVITDWDTERQIIHNAVMRTTGQARGYVQDWYNDASHRPDERAKTQTVTVEVRNVLPQSANTFLVDWIERAHDLNGSPTGVESWRGQFTIQMRPVDTLDLASTNPTGFFISELHWSAQVK